MANRSRHHHGVIFYFSLSRLSKISSISKSCWIFLQIIFTFWSLFINDYHYHPGSSHIILTWITEKHLITVLILPLLPQRIYSLPKPRVTHWNIRQIMLYTFKGSPCHWEWKLTSMWKLYTICPLVISLISYSFPQSLLSSHIGLPDVP